MQVGREATTPISSLYLKAFLTCVKKESGNISLTRNTVQSVHVQTPVSVAHSTPFRRRFNLQKADRKVNSTELDTLIEDVEPSQKIGGFVEKVRVDSRRDIPRGFRTNYIAGLS